MYSVIQTADYEFDHRYGSIVSIIHQRLLAVVVRGDITCGSAERVAVDTIEWIMW